ncbi:STAR protein, partial [Heliornis fulica]|nr:STAR protein [Heliornis fulica]
MLRATVKLCCGIAHDHLQSLPGLKTTAVVVIQKDTRGMVARRSHHLPSRIPRRTRRAMGKEAATCPDPTGDISLGQFSSTDLSYIAQGEAALQQALSILQWPTSWQAESALDTGTSMSSATLPGLGKVFRVEAVLPVPVARLHQELFERIEQMPQWNPTLSRVKVLRRVGTDTLVTHEVTTPSPGNVVGQRDFVSVRHRGRREMDVYLVGATTHLEQLPMQEGCIRYSLRNVMSQGIMGTPPLWGVSLPQGWIPTSVINRVLPQSQADFIKHLQRHLS